MDFVVGNSLTVVSTGGTEYKNADFKYPFSVIFSDLWAEYDEKVDGLCQVEDVKVMVVRK